MRLRLTAALVLLVALGGCELFHEQAVDPDDIDFGRVEDISFGQHVQPLLTAKCTDCHGSRTAEGGLRLDSWGRIVAGSERGSVVVPYSPAHSSLVTLTRASGPAHPAELGGDTLTTVEAEFLARWVREGAMNDDGAVPYDDAEAFVYVTNQDAGTVSVIDAERQVVARVVDFTALGYGGAPKPHHVAVEADGSAWYVSLIGANTIVKLDRENEVVEDALTETPGLLALHPDDDLLLAGRSMTAVSPPPSLAFLDRTTMAVREVPVGFARPHALAVHGAHAYVASLAENRLAAVERATGDVDVYSVLGPQQMFVQFAVAPDGTTLWVTAEMTGQVHVFSLANPAAPAFLRTIDVGRRPWHPVFSLDGRRLYVPLKGDDAVAVVDTRTFEVAERITGEGLAGPHGAALSPDGATLFVSNNNTAGTYTPTGMRASDAPVGTVVAIDLSTNEITRVVEVGANPTGVGAPTGVPAMAGARAEGRR